MDLPPPYAQLSHPPLYREEPQQSKKLLPKSGSAFSFTLNGKQVTVDPSADPSLTPNTTLAMYLRTKTKYTSTKIFCHEGGCGACMVSITSADATQNNKQVTHSVNSCLRPLFSCNGVSITTNDGLSNGGRTPHPIQQALADHNGSQCGYCSNGMVMTMYSLMCSNPQLTKLQIEKEFDGSLCRCTGYRPILDAMKSFATSGCEDDEDCKLKGCQNRGKFKDVEDINKLLPKMRSFEHVHPTAHKGSRSKVSFSESGDVWQDCATIDDLNFWLPWYSAQPVDIMLVVGQTSLGVYPKTTAMVRLNIAPIVDFLIISQNSQGILIGPSVTIHDAMLYLQDATGPFAYSNAHLAQAANHLSRVASTGIRHSGSLMGNVALTLNHQSGTDFFCSDVATLLYGLGATYDLYDPTTKTATLVPQDQLFTLGLKGCYVRSILIPWAVQNELFMSYKIAVRQANSHALVNAAMRAVVDPTSHTVTSQPVLVIGGIEARPTRYTAVEQAMVGANVTSLATLKELATQLQSLLKPVQFSGRVAFRISAAVNYFYKFFLFLQPVLPATLTSAAECWMTRPVSSGTQSFLPNPAEYPVSIGIPKLESIQQTTGMAKYTDDMSLPEETLFASLVLSTQGNCTFSSIDATAALAMQGVVAFYSAKDIPSGRNAWQNGEILSSGVIQFYGQALGVIVATTRQFADEAASAVNVTYTNIKAPVVTLDEAIANNAAFPPQQQPAPVVRGDSAAAMKTANRIIKGSTELGFQYHFHMENHIVTVVPREDELEVRSATQMPVQVQQQVAGITGMNGSKVVVSTKRCGGGFGGKITSSLQPAAIAAFCSQKVGGPISLLVDLQHTTSLLGSRCGKRMDYEIGVMNDGTIVAFNAIVYCGAGVFDADCFGAALTTIHSLDTAYYIPNANFSSTMMMMNIAATTAVRGPGWVAANYFMECAISDIASQLSLEPNAVREKNFFVKGQSTCDGMLLPYWNMPTIWSDLQTDAQYANRVVSVAQFNAVNRFRKRGLAMTPMRFGVGQTGGNFDSVVNIYLDGTVGITHGGSEIGQGINTKVIQVAAYKFGLNQSQLAMITVNETSTRSISAGSNVTGGSVTSELCCLSVMHACETLTRRLAPLRQSGQSWGQLIMTASQAGVELSAAGWTNAPINANGIFNYNSNAASVAEVEVDALTGQYEIKQVDILFDCGISLNATIDIGQIEGGFMFGMGYFLQEEISWDATTGKPQNPSTWEYKIPCAFDVPEVFNTTLLRNAPNPVGVLGSKAVGEPGVAMAASVVQALESAITSARAANGQGNQRWVCRRGPLSVDKVLAACSTTVDQFTLS